MPMDAMSAPSDVVIGVPLAEDVAIDVARRADRATGLTVNTSLPPAPRTVTKSRDAKATTPTLRTRSASSSALLSASSTTPSPASSSRVTASASATAAKRASPRCASPASSDRSSWMRSPGASPSSAAATSNGSTTSSTNSATNLLSRPMSLAMYFRLLKKSHVLDQLLQVSSHLESQEQQLRKLQTERAKTESVQAHVFHELDEFKHKFVEAQQFMLEIVEALTGLCIQEDELQRGTGTKDAVAIAAQTREERVLQELEAEVKAARGSSCGESPRNRSSTSSGLERSVESRALLDVGLGRVRQLETACAGYELQIRKLEAELSRAMHSTYKNECLAKLAHYEETQQAHADTTAELTRRIENLQLQTSELNDTIDDQRDNIARMQQENENLTCAHQRQAAAIEQFGADLKAELRKRYGVVPGVVDLRWHQYFPGYALPQ